LDDARRVVRNSRLPIVALTFNQDLDSNLEAVETVLPFALQLQGEETPELIASLNEKITCEIWKALHLPPQEEDGEIDLDRLLNQAKEYQEAGANCFMVDSSTVIDGVKRYGGTGKTVDWGLARKIVKQIKAPVFLAGGIDPENVVEAFETVRPFGIDLSSGVEREKGKKDPVLVRALIQNIRDRRELKDPGVAY
jgi:phosphoribosylanthranilate isomerase